MFHRDSLRWATALTLGIFACLWLILINHLRVEWSVNPQYSYGWMVPVLCLGLVLQRWQADRNVSQKPDERGHSPILGDPPSASPQWLTIALFVALAFLWVPTRLVQNANPEWRMISWLLAIEVVGLTLLAVRFQMGGEKMRLILVPLCFFFVAVPWPTIIEGPLIQLLTRLCAAVTLEPVSWFGIPAVRQGNTIVVATGTVGIDEACSGIRSFQSSLMISLFLGELYRLGLLRRLFLIPAGFVLALTFNVCRTTLLTCVAARKGIQAIAEYHDQAGLTILLACTLSLWALALMLKGRRSKTNQPQPATGPAQPVIAEQPNPNPGLDRGSVCLSAGAGPWPGTPRLIVALLVWLVVGEIGVELWYRVHEARLPKSVSWVMQWPRKNPTFAQVPIGEKATRMLRYDEAFSATWKEDDGSRWHMTYLRWLPGRIAVHLAKMHTPEACLTAAGGSVQTLPGLNYLQVHGLKLPFRFYVLDRSEGPVYVFYCLWEDRAQDQFFQTQSLTYGYRLGPVMAGQRNAGQRSLEVMVQGLSTLDDAQKALIRQLEKLLRVNGTELSSRN